MLCAGYYRIKNGSEIVESFFDTTTGKIGPYKIDTKLDVEAFSVYSGIRTVPAYRFVETLIWDPDALAVFEISLRILCVITPTKFYQIPVSPADNVSCYSETYAPIVDNSNLIHVGYFRTVPPTKAVAVLPYKMFMDRKTGKVPGHNIKLSGNAVENPDYILYKALAYHPNATAVYLNTATGKPAFITEEK